MIQIKSILNLTLLILLLHSGNIYSQASVNTTGSDIRGPGGSVAYSVGQVAYTTNAGISGTVAQGVQHAYEIFAVNTEESATNILVSVFPNPVSDALILRMDGYTNESHFVEMTEIQGRLLQKTLISSKDTQIDMAVHPASTYLLHVMNTNNKKIKTFKIIKN